MQKMVQKCVQKMFCPHCLPPMSGGQAGNKRQDRSSSILHQSLVIVKKNYLSSTKNLFSTSQTKNKSG